MFLSSISGGLLVGCTGLEQPHGQTRIGVTNIGFAATFYHKFRNQAGKITANAFHKDTTKQPF